MDRHECMKACCHASMLWKSVMRRGGEREYAVSSLNAGQRPPSGRWRALQTTGVEAHRGTQDRSFGLRPRALAVRHPASRPLQLRPEAPLGYTPPRFISTLYQALRGNFKPNNRLRQAFVRNLGFDPLPSEKEGPA